MTRNLTIDDFTLRAFDKMALKTYPELDKFTLNKHNPYDNYITYSLTYTVNYLGDSIYAKVIASSPTECLDRAKELMDEKIVHYNYMARDNVYDRGFIINQAVYKQMYLESINGIEHNGNYRREIKKSFKKPKNVLEGYRKLMKSVKID